MPVSTKHKLVARGVFAGVAKLERKLMDAEMELATANGMPPHIAYFNPPPGLTYPAQKAAKEKAQKLAQRKIDRLQPLLQSLITDLYQATLIIHEGTARERWDPDYHNHRESCTVGRWESSDQDLSRQIVTVHWIRISGEPFWRGGVEVEVDLQDGRRYRPDHRTCFAELYQPGT